MNDMRMTVEERFASKYEVGPNGCWIWLRSKDRKGYGSFRVDGRSLRAHRWAYETFVDEIAAMHDIHHLCGEPSCVNPAHLQALPISDHARLSATRTHCRRGHEFTADNMLVERYGVRRCLICYRRKETRRSLRRSLRRQNVLWGPGE